MSNQFFLYCAKMGENYWKLLGIIGGGDKHFDYDVQSVLTIDRLETIVNNDSAVPSFIYFLYILFVVLFF